MTTPGKMSFEERERRALAIYEAKIRPLISPADERKFVMIDVLSEDYEIGENPIDTGRTLRTRRPEGIINTIQGHHLRVMKFRVPRHKIVRESQAQQ